MDWPIAAVLIATIATLPAYFWIHRAYDKAPMHVYHHGEETEH